MSNNGVSSTLPIDITMPGDLIPAAVSKILDRRIDGIPESGRSVNLVEQCTCDCSSRCTLEPQREECRE